MIKKLIWSLLLLAVLSVSFYLYREYNRKPSDLQHVQAAFFVTAADLVNEFEIDEQAANEKYLDRVIQVSGLLTHVSRQNDSLVNITLGNGLHKVGCMLDKKYADRIGRYQVSKPILIKGICTGYLMDVELNRCVIIE